ncbi:MAG: sulfatase-like hydrolase/transferase [Planctomycetes bacterium]|nr:sulfatase-like hydrolase/transferase [Planctomycetota bacterium]
MPRPLAQPFPTSLPRLLAVLLLAFALLSQARLAAQANTLLIVADDVGVDNVTCYGLGANPPPTPNIDALAARGVRFANAQACPLCSPTRASILTGRHGFRTGIGTALTGGPGLDPSEVLLPEILSPAGVQTALIGKWHLGSDLGAATPTAEGFGEFTGSLQGAINDYYSWPKVTNGVIATETTYATTDLVDEALAFVGRTQGPWFVMLAFHAGHTPLHAPPAGLHTQSLAGLNPTTSPIPFFRAMVQAMDSEIGRLLSLIPPATLANTNIVFLGDNGSSQQTTSAPFDPTRAKGTIYQGGVRVPCIAAGPAVGGSPRVESGLLHVVDLFATLAGMQGVDARAAVPATVELDTIDQRALLLAPGAPPRQFSYTQAFSGSTAMTAAGDTEAMRDARFELLRFQQSNGTVREELYDLTSDPWETTNLLLQPLSTTADAAYRDLWLELARLRGYSWSQPFGAGCSGGGLTPSLRAITPPAIGTVFTMRVTGISVAASATFGTFGFADDVWNGTPLPWDLTPLGMTGCSLLLATDTTVFLPRTNTVATWVLPLPAFSSLLGLHFFTQGFVLVPGANPAEALSTRALEIVVGN